jgi:hypothetical protein
VVAIAIPITVLLVFFLLLQAPDDLFKRGFTKLVGFNSLVLFVLLEARFDLLPGIG